MRHVVLVFFGFLMPFVLFSQGNLQFNQVLLLTATGTVPSGKVWKVESVLSSSTLAANNNNPPSVNTVSLDIVVDGITIVGRAVERWYCFANGKFWRHAGAIGDMPRGE